MVFALWNGMFLSSKHCSVRLGWNSLTRLKRPVGCLSKLKHSISYEQMKEIETTRAELALNLSKKSSILPLILMYSDNKVHNYSFKGFKIWIKSIYARLLLGD